MSRHASQGPWHSECTKDEGCKKGDTLSRGKREVWGASVDRGRHVRNKRYSGISNPPNEDVREISMVPGNNAERNDDISKVYLKRKADFRWVKYGNGMFHLGTAKNCRLLESDNVTSFLPLLFNQLRGESSKDYKGTNARTPGSAIFRVQLNSKGDLKSINCQDKVPNHIQRDGSLTFSHFLTSWLKVSLEGSSKIFIQNRTKGSFPSPAISKNKQHFKYNLKPINLGEHGFHRFQRQRNHEFFSPDSVERSSTSSLFFSNNSQEISELSAKDSASTDVPAKLDLKSTEDSSVVDVGGSYLPSSSSVTAGNGRSPLWDSTKIARSPFDLKFKGSRAESEREVSGKSKALEVDTRRKVLYPRTGRAASGSSSRRASPPQLFQPEGQKPLSFRAPPRWIAHFESPFKSHDTINEPDDNTEPADFHRDTKFNSSNSGLPRARRRPGVFKGSQRRSLRRRRDANDGTRGAFLRPLSKNQAPTRSSTYFDKFTESGSSVQGRKIGSRSLEPGDSDAGGGRWRPKYIRRSFAESPPVIYSKCCANIRAHKPRSFLYTDAKMAPSVEGVYDILSSFNGPVFNYVSSKTLAEGGWDGRGKRKGDSFKQLWIVKDNLYQRTKGSLLREKSVAGEAEKMEPDRHPVGGPSLLPDSYPRFMGDYGSPASGTSRNSRPSRSSRAKDQGRWSLGGEVEARGAARTWIFDFRAAFMGFLKALGFLVQVGRQIMDYVDANSALTCTRDYFWSKAIQWIEA